MLQPPIESAQFRSIRYGETLAESDIGSRGDSFDDAMAEALKSVHKVELIARRRWFGLI